MTGPLFPAVFTSDVDATDHAAGIHCGPINPKLGHLGVEAARRLLKLVNLE